MQVAEHRLHLSVEHLVRAPRAADGLKRAAVERGPVDHHLGLHLRRDAFEPPSLLVRPRAAREHAREGRVHARRIGLERIPEGALADVPDDRRGDVLVGGLPPRHTELRLAVPGVIEGLPHLLERLARELTRPLEHRAQGRDAIEGRVEKGSELVEVVFRALVEVLPLAHDLVLMLGDVHHDGHRGALVEQTHHRGVRGDPGRGFVG